MNYCVVKRDFTFKSTVPIILIALLTLFASFLTVMIGFVYLPIVVFLVGAIVDIYLSPRFLKTEYEYSIEGGIFSAALIMNKKARKELFSADIEKLISCAPLDGPTVASGMLKKINAASSENPAYSAMFSADDGSVLVLFSPTQEFMNELRLLAPSKVKLAR